MVGEAGGCVSPEIPPPQRLPLGRDAHRGTPPMPGTPRWEATREEPEQEGAHSRGACPAVAAPKLLAPWAQPHAGGAAGCYTPPWSSAPPQEATLGGGGGMLGLRPPPPFQPPALPHGAGLRQTARAAPHGKKPSAANLLFPASGRVSSCCSGQLGGRRAGQGVAGLGWGGGGGGTAVGDPQGCCIPTPPLCSLHPTPPGTAGWHRGLRTGPAHPSGDGSGSRHRARGRRARVSVRPRARSLSGPAQPQEAASGFPVPGASRAGAAPRGGRLLPGWGAVPTVPLLRHRGGPHVPVIICWAS